MPSTTVHRLIGLVVVALAILTAHAASQAGSSGGRFVVDPNWVPTEIERPDSGRPGYEDQRPNVLHFRNGHQLVVDLFEVQFLGQLPRLNRAPLLLLGARGCFSCDIEAQVYPIPADAQRYEYGKRAAYYYPGSLSGGGDPTATTTFYRSRMFIGKCLTDRQPVVVWFEQQLDSAQHWRPDVYRLSVVGDSVRGEFMTPMPPLSSTVRAMRAGLCFEVQGLDQTQY